MIPLMFIATLAATPSPRPLRPIPPACFARSAIGCGYRQKPVARFVTTQNAPRPETIQYSWTKSGFVVLRKELSVEKSGVYKAAYNGKRACNATGTLSPSVTAALWKDAGALTGSTELVVDASPKSRHIVVMTPAAMDNGPPVETLVITDGAVSRIYHASSPAARHLLDQLRQLLPNCAL